MSIGRKLISLCCFKQFRKNKLCLQNDKNFCTLKQLTCLVVGGCGRGGSQVNTTLVILLLWLTSHRCGHHCFVAAKVLFNSCCVFTTVLLLRFSSIHYTLTIICTVTVCAKFFPGSPQTICGIWKKKKTTTTKCLQTVVRQQLSKTTAVLCALYYTPKRVVKYKEQATGVAVCLFSVRSRRLWW